MDCKTPLLDVHYGVLVAFGTSELDQHSLQTSVVPLVFRVDVPLLVAFAEHHHYQFDAPDDSHSSLPLIAHTTHLSVFDNANATVAMATEA